MTAAIETPAPACSPHAGAGPTRRLHTITLPAGLPPRFRSKVQEEAPLPVDRPDLGPCWVWQGAVTSAGYGLVWDGQRVRGAHVFAYVLLVGPIPEGLHLDHLCRVRRCVNPAHLEPVTPGENVRRGNSPSAIAARTGVCAKGHPLTDENVTVIRLSPLKRRCKVCHRERQARYNAAGKDA